MPSKRLIEAVLKKIGERYILEEHTDESFDSIGKRHEHSIIHVAETEEKAKKNPALFPPMSDEEYEEQAEILANETATASNPNSKDDILAFKSKEGEIIKYRQSSNEFVIYYPPDHIKTYYKGDWNHRYSELYYARFGRDLRGYENNGLNLDKGVRSRNDKRK